jgi:hypothetical protein
MRRFVSLVGFGLVAGLAVGPAAAVDGVPGTPVVVEFYTSQGCSSCPPADELFAEIAGIPGVIALALHVDYWDYLGWEDVFGRAAHTARQKAYAKAHRERTIYTPQMIVEGEDLLIGHDEESLRARIAAHAAQPAAVSVALDRIGAMLRIVVEPASGPVGPAEVQFVEYLPSRTVTVEGGENAGYRHDFVNIVTRWATIGRWDGQETVEIDHEIDAEAGDGVAVIVQSPRHGPILGAAALR